VEMLLLTLNEYEEIQVSAGIVNVEPIYRLDMASACHAEFQ